MAPKLAAELPLLALALCAPDAPDGGSARLRLCASEARSAGACSARRMRQRSR
jgi:hypothetical protein